LSATSANFQELVVENSREGLVLVGFWAPWAGPFLRQGELRRRLAAEFGGRFLLVAVDTDREKPIAQGLGVKSLPSCRLFRRGRVLEAGHGMRTEADDRALSDRDCVARAQAAAAEPWGRGEKDRAIETLAELAEIHGLDAGFRDGITGRGLPAILEQLAPNDPRTRACGRRLLHQ
jgi:putative thioredoxin